MERTGEAFEPDKDKTTNQLSAFFSVVVQKLLQTLTREDWSDDNLRVQATEVYIPSYTTTVVLYIVLIAYLTYAAVDSTTGNDSEGQFQTSLCMYHLYTLLKVSVKLRAQTARCLVQLCNHCTAATESITSQDLVSSILPSSVCTHISVCALHLLSCTLFVFGAGDECVDTEQCSRHDICCCRNSQSCTQHA
jgi:hypothetical protein